MSEKIKNTLRKFGLSTFAVDNAASVIVLTFMIMLFGISSYQNMPKEQFPEVTMPTIFVNTLYFGNSAKDIENLITRPIEKELKSITGIKDIKSTSLQDYSVITAEFETFVPNEEALRKVKDAVDKSKKDLPNDLTQEPDVFDVNLANMPVVTINLSGDFSNDELRGYGEYLQDEIEALNGVSTVDIKGDLEREIRIDIDIPKMESVEVSFGDVENAIKSENMNMSGGEIVANDFRRAVRVVGEFETMKDVENIIVKSENGNPVFLKDLATVTYGYKDRTSYARSDALPVISCDIIKRKGTNLLETIDKVKVIVADARKNIFPENLKVSYFNDQSIQTRDQVENLENSIIFGVILVVLVLLFFLGLRNSLFVGIAIPLSMMMGIMIMYMLGYTMNMVVLFALILALGMLVDNGIVVVENIYRYMQEGYSPIDAAKYGAGEVAIPIIASTATTLAAFIPLAFWPGIMGSFMKFLPITLIIVLSSSLFVALVINPVLTSLLMKIEVKNTDASVRKRVTINTLIGAAVMFILGLVFHLIGEDLYWARNLIVITACLTLIYHFILKPLSISFQNSLMPRIENLYSRFIRGAVKSFVPYLIFAGTFALLFISLGLLNSNMPKIEFFPEADPIYVNAFVEMPIGSDIEGTNKVMKELEQKIDNVVQPYSSVVEAVLSQIGEGTSDPGGPPEPGASPHKARLTVSFVPDKQRGGVSTSEIMEKIRDAVKGYAGVEISVAQNQNGPPTGKDINIEIKGDDINQLSILANDVKEFLDTKNIGGVEGLSSDVKLGKSEIEININKQAARRYGLSTYAISNTIRTAIFGKEVSKFKVGEDEYPMVVRVAEKYRNSLSSILGQKITFRNPANGRISQVPITAVASFKTVSTYSSIKRRDLKRVITVFSNVTKDYNANEVVQEIKDYMADYKMPKGYSFDFTGQQEEQAEAMAFLGSAFGVALFSIFLILVLQFNSVLSPFIIIMSIVFSTIGVFLGYVISGDNLVIIMTGMGIISLAGIVVNNAIVLIDYTNIKINEKIEESNLIEGEELPSDTVREAIIEAGKTRLRPVLLTAITTVLGLFPMALGLNINFFTLITELDPHYFLGGDNADFWGPMAWTVIYGLIFSTFLTLVVVPVMYWLIYSIKRATLAFFKPA